MAKTVHKWTVTAALLCLAGGAYAVEGDPAAGQGKAGLCAGCHGADGNSRSAQFPRLAAQYEDYIAKQVQDFKEGVRNNNATMAGMAQQVASKEDAHDIGAHFASQEMADEPLEPVDQELASKGEKIFYEGVPQAGVYACVNCHGERGKGKAPDVSVFPVVGGQHRDYLLKQLKDFKSGDRTNDPAGMMGDIADKLSEDQMEAVAEYLSGLL